MTMKRSSIFFDLTFFALIVLLFAFTFFGAQGWLRHNVDRPDPRPLTVLQGRPAASVNPFPTAAPAVKRQTIS